ncbi:MAG: hypothetical protein WEC00_12115 [Dongiaceae bacterium]
MEALAAWLAESGLWALGPEALGYAPSHETKKALNRCRDGLRVLMFLARCDGHLHPAEMAVVDGYIAERSDLDSDDTRALAHLRRFAERLYPTPDCFVASARRLARPNAGSTHLMLVAESARALIEADGEIGEREFSAGLELADILREMAARPPD